MKKIRISNQEMLGRIASMPGRHCPFVSNPFEECLISNINSQNIDEAIYYCGNNFEECGIYGGVDKQDRRLDDK
jgi:hypothetical protein